MRKTLGRGAIYLAISSLILMLAGYIVNIFLGRVLGPVTYGTYGIVISLMTAGNLMQTAGLPQAISKFIAEDESKADAVLKSGLSIQIISTISLTVLFFLLAKPLALLFHDDTLIPYIQFTSLIFPLYGIFALYAGYYNGLHNFKRQSFLNILYAIVKVSSILFFVNLFHLFGVILGFIISPILALLFGVRIPKKPINSFPYRKLILFSLPLVGFAIFANLLQSIDLFFIKALLHSDKETGFYTASQNIAEIPFYAVATLASVLFPSVSRHVSQNLPDTKKLISKSLRFSLILLMPSILLLSATSLHVLRLLYSTTYSQGAEALAILTIGNGFFTLFILLSTIMSGSGSPVKSSLLAGVGVVINSLLCTLLIPTFGLSGAAFATTISSCIVAVVAAFIVYQRFNVLFSLKSTSKIIVASLIIYGFAQIISIPVLLLPILYLFLFIVYSGLLLLLKEITQEDITMITSLLPQWMIRKGKHD